MLWVVVCVASEYDGNMSVCAVNVMQWHVPVLHSLFLAGNVVTFHLPVWYLSPSPGLSGSQITTRCSENGDVTDTPFKIPSNRLQSFLYRH